MARFFRRPHCRAGALAIALVLLTSPGRAPGEIKVWVAGSGNWTNNFAWSPTGVPNDGDDCFLTQNDSTNRTVTYNDTSLILRVYRSVRMDSTGSGLMTLTQTNPATTLHADFLYIGNAVSGAYNLSAGAGRFGATELHAQGSLSVASGASFISDTFLQTGGTISAPAELSVPVRYTYNGGTFIGTSGSGTMVTGRVKTGTFTTNLPSFGGGLEVSTALILNNPSTTIGGDLINRTATFTLIAGRSLHVAQTLSQVGGTFNQFGNVTQPTGGVIGVLPHPAEIGGGGVWNQQGGTRTGATLDVGTEDGIGRYNLIAGSTNFSNNIILGPFSDGTFTQSGTSRLTTGLLIVGGVGGGRGIAPPPGKRGFFSISGGTLSSGAMGTTLIIGEANAIGGTFTQTGGTSEIRQLHINQNATSSGLLNISGGVFNVSGLAVSNGTFTQTGGSAFFAENLDGAGSVSVTGTGSLTVRRLRQVAAHVGGNGRILAGPSSTPPATHRVQSLTFEESGNAILGTWDLGATNLVIDYAGASPIADVRTYLASGYNGGDWSGTGLRFTLVNAPPRGLGYIEAFDMFGPSGGVFEGVLVDASAILIKRTRYGDANLDGIVNLQDFNRLAGNFGGSNKLWSQGDFNYDGLVNLSDFNLLAANFGLSAAGPEVTPQDWSNLAAAIPEPSLLLLPGMAASAGMLRRRRYR